MKTRALNKLEKLNKSVAILKGNSIIKTQKDISILMRMNQNTISQALKGNEKYFTDSFLKKFALTFPSIDKNWLLSESSDNASEPTTEYKPEGKIINNSNYPTKNVFVIPVKGRGGLETNYFDEVMFSELEKEELTVKTPSSKNSKWFKIEVEGISMDDDSKKSLAEGDWAYCRSIGKHLWRNKLHSHKYPIFCFFHNERGIIFKSIKDQNIENGELVLSSLHPDKNKFPDFTIKIAECSYICNVIKVLSEF